MIKNILILILLILCISNVNGAITITSVSKSISYGNSGTVSIVGNGFVVGATTVITIGGQQGIIPQCTTTTSCDCAYNALLPDALSTYNITITQGSITGSANVFKYIVPSIITHTIQYGNEVLFTVRNAPANFSNYKAQINDGISVYETKLKPDSTGSVSLSVFLFTIPQSVSAGELIITLIDPYGFIYSPVKETIQPTIISMSSIVFDLSGTVVTITGTFLGKTATVIIGTTAIPVTVTSDDTTCSFTFTTTTRYEYPLSITIKNAAGSLITSDSAGNPLSFKYLPPIITASSFTQEDGEVVIKTNNTGTDKSQMVLTINSVTSTITSFIDGIIRANIPHALLDGETIFSLTSGPFDPFESKLLIAPIVTSPAFYIPAIGGNITITGMFLKNSHVFIGEPYTIKNEITCTSNQTGESIACNLKGGNGTISLTIVNYNDLKNTTQGYKLSTCTVKYQPAPTSPPPVTVSPTETPYETQPTTPTQIITQTPSHTSPTEEKEPSSSSIKLISTFFSLVSFILLI